MENKCCELYNGTLDITNSCIFCKTFHSSPKEEVVVSTLSPQSTEVNGIKFINTCNENNVNMSEDGTGAMKMINEWGKSSPKVASWVEELDKLITDNQCECYAHNEEDCPIIHKLKSFISSTIKEEYQKGYEAGRNSNNPNCEC